MAGTEPTIGRPSRAAGRFVAALPAVPVVAVGLLATAFSVSTSAAWVRAPVITPTEVTFTIPSGSTSTWLLNLWSRGTVAGSDRATTGTLTVAVPTTSGCAFQADVSILGAGGRQYYYSGARATLPYCGPSLLVGHIYLCSASGAPTTTEVTGGTLTATGPQTVGPQGNPLVPTSVKAGSYVMAAAAPSGHVFVSCGTTATVGSGGATASESVTVPNGGTGTAAFYVTPVVPAGTVPGGSGPPASGSGSGPKPSSSPAVGSPRTKKPASTLTATTRPTTATTAVTGSQLAFTGQNTVLLVLVGVGVLALGMLSLLVARLRRRPVVVRPDSRRRAP